MLTESFEQQNYPLIIINTFSNRHTRQLNLDYVNFICSYNEYMKL
jgi:hypothetical protein